MLDAGVVAYQILIQIRNAPPRLRHLNARSQLVELYVEA